MINQKLNIELPTIRKDIVLMSPGIWNGFEYSAEDIKHAFENTDWKKASNLFLDHPENPNNAAGSWIGRVINQRFSDGQIMGDLELWDTNTIIKTEMAKAPLGVSPRVIGEENGNKFSNFVFDNWSVVSKQAIDPAYINLNKTPLKAEMLIKTEKELVKELSEEVKEYNRVSEKILKEEELTDDEYEYMKKKMKKKEKEEKATIKENESDSKKEKLKGGKEEMSETNQVEIVSATQNEKKELSFEELSIEELNAILEKVQTVISSKTPKVQEMAKQDLGLKEELEAMRKQVQELNSKLNKPVSKTTRANANDIRATLNSQTHSDGVREMASILVNNYG